MPATDPTDRGNGATEKGTDTTNQQRKRPPLRTAWELPELINRRPRRGSRRPVGKCQPWYGDVVAGVHELRFVTAAMLMRRFSQWLTSERTAQRHLKNLVDYGYLATVSPWAVGPNFPYVYHATPRGLKYVKREYGERIVLDASPAEEKRSRGHGLHSLLHELFISEFMLDVMQTVGERDDLKLLEMQRRYFRRANRLVYLDDGERKTIEPDLGFLVAVKGETGEWSPLPMHFVEVENGTHSKRDIEQKLNAYRAWGATTGTEYLTEKYHRHGFDTRKPEYRVLVVCHDKYGTVGDRGVLADWLIKSGELPKRMRDRLWFSTVRDLSAARQRRQLLASNVWYRKRKSRQITSDEPNGESVDTRTPTKRREFAESFVDASPTHGLFATRPR